MINRTYFFSCVFLDGGIPTHFHRHQTTRRSWRDESPDVLVECVEFASSRNPDKGECFVIAFNRC